MLFFNEFDDNFVLPSTPLLSRLVSLRTGRWWSGVAMVMGKLPVPRRPISLDNVRQGSTVLALGAGGGCSDIFSLICHLSSLKTAQYRLKYCLKGP